MGYRRNSMSNNISSSKEKQTWPEQLWQWISKITKWTCDTLFNTIALSRELIMSLTSKLSEKLWNNNPEIVNIRKAITEHHLNQAKKSLNKLSVQFPEIFKWIYHTSVWTVKTVVWSWRDMIHWLRNDETKKLTDGNTEEWTEKHAA